MNLWWVAWRINLPLLPCWYTFIQELFQSFLHLCWQLTQPFLGHRKQEKIQVQSKMLRQNMVNPSRGASPPRGWRCALAVWVGRPLLPGNTLLECADTVHQTQHCGCLHRGRRSSHFLHQQDTSVFNPNNTGWWRGREESKIHWLKHTSEELLEVRLDDVWVCCLAENL